MRPLSAQGIGRTVTNGARSTLQTGRDSLLERRQALRGKLADLAAFPLDASGGSGLEDLRAVARPTLAPYNVDSGETAVVAWADPSC